MNVYCAGVCAVEQVTNLAVVNSVLLPPAVSWLQSVVLWYLASP